MTSISNILASLCVFSGVTAIPLITTNGLYGTQWTCSQCTTVITSPASTQPIVNKNKLQLQIAQCEWILSKFKCSDNNVERPTRKWYMSGGFVFLTYGRSAFK